MALNFFADSDRGDRQSPGDLPISRSNTVILSKGDYEALIGRVEDADDRVAAAAAEARDKALGVKAARADALPLDLVKALSDGIHPVRMWRKHRRMTLQDLSAATRISHNYLTEIDTGKSRAAWMR
jgi:hypothetical protein